MIAGIRSPSEASARLARMVTMQAVSISLPSPRSRPPRGRQTRSARRRGGGPATAPIDPCRRAATGSSRSPAPGSAGTGPRRGRRLCRASPSARALTSGPNRRGSFAQDGNEAPAHERELPRPANETDDRDRLARRDVVARREPRDVLRWPNCTATASGAAVRMYRPHMIGRDYPPAPGCYSSADRHLDDAADQRRCPNALPRYPDRPVLGVSTFVRRGDSVLLVRRGKAAASRHLGLPRRPGRVRRIARRRGGARGARGDRNHGDDRRTDRPRRDRAPR